MPRLDLYNVGESVVLQGMPLTIAKILSKTNSSISVDVEERWGLKKRYTTTWAPATVVALYIPEKPTVVAQPSPTPSPPVKPQEAQQPAKPSKASTKPAKAETEAPKPAKGKAEVDVFGVRKGTMAAAVNAFLLANRKNVKVADIVDGVKGSKKDNVQSHLKRMVGDGLLTNSGKGKELVVSVPKGIK